VSRLAQLTGMSRPTIAKGVTELQGRTPLSPPEVAGFERPEAAGRRWKKVDPEVRRQLTRIVEETTAAESAELAEVEQQIDRAIATS